MFIGIKPMKRKELSKNKLLNLKLARIILKKDSFILKNQDFYFIRTKIPTIDLTITFVGTWTV